MIARGEDRVQRLFRQQSGIPVLDRRGAVMQAGGVQLRHRRRAPSGARVEAEGETAVGFPDRPDGARYVAKSSFRIRQRITAVRVHPAVGAELLRVVAYAEFQFDLRLLVAFDPESAVARVLEVGNEEAAFRGVGLPQPAEPDAAGEAVETMVFPHHVRRMRGDFELQLRQVQSRERIVQRQVLVVFVAEVVLPCAGHTELARVTRQPPGADFEQLVFDALVRTTDRVRKTRRFERSLAVERPLQVGQVADVRSGEDPQRRVELRVEDFGAIAFFLPSERAGEIGFFETGVFQKVIRRFHIAGFLQRTLRAPRERRQEGVVAFDPSGHRAAAAVARAYETEFAFQSGCVAQRFRLRDHHPGNGVGAVPHTGRAFHHTQLAGDERVHFRRVFAAPLLALLANAVVQHQHAVAVQAVDHRLGDRVAGVQARHPADALQRLAQREAAAAVELLFAEAVGGLGRTIRDARRGDPHRAQLFGMVLRVEVDPRSARHPHDLQQVVAAHVRDAYRIGAVAQPVDAITAAAVGESALPGLFDIDRGIFQPRAVVVVEHAARERAGTGLREQGRGAHQQKTANEQKVQSFHDCRLRRCTFAMK